MWSAALAILNGLLNAFNAWQAGRQRDADRDAGRDAANVEAAKEVLDASAKAKTIQERVDSLDDAELERLLRRPKNNDS